MMASAKKFSHKRMLVIIIFVIVAVFAISMVTTKLVYDGVFSRYDQPVDIPQTLETMVKQRCVHQFSSGENRLTGYLYNPIKSGPANGLIVLVPGFSAGADDYLWQIRELVEYGWGVFTFDATGTQRSEGKNQVGFSQSVPDLEAALKYVENNRNFGYNELVLMGHSRGAYAACCVLPQTRDVAAVVSVSGINSAMEGVMHMSVQAAGPISYGNYGFLWLYQAMLFGTDTLQLQAYEAISRTDVPVLVVHGREDTQIPTDACSIISHAQDITSSKVEYMLWDAGHTDILYDDDGTANDALIEKIHNFLLRSIGQ